MLGEMFRGSSRVKKNFAATDPVRRAREARWLLRRAIPLLNSCAAQKTANSRYVNSRYSILTCQIEKLSQNANYEWMTTITPKAFANMSPGLALSPTLGNQK